MRGLGGVEKPTDVVFWLVGRPETFQKKILGQGFFCFVFAGVLRYFYVVFSNGVASVTFGGGTCIRIRV
jgi:hypothetical protein